MAMLGKGRALTQLEGGISRANQALNGFDFVSGGLNADEAKRFAVSGVTSMVREALLRSYAASGIKTVTGQLKATVGSAGVTIGRGKLRIAMRGGLPNKHYAKASALNYGAVRQPYKRYSDQQLLGGRAKRTLKRATLQNAGKLSARELRRFQKGVKQRHVNANTGFVQTLHRDAFKIGDASVVKPKPYFYISGADQKLISDKITALVNQYINRKLGVKTKATA